MQPWARGHRLREILCSTTNSVKWFGLLAVPWLARGGHQGVKKPPGAGGRSGRWKRKSGGLIVPGAPDQAGF